MHFALGNLFRRRGEYERAVRVHEHLLQRGDLPQPERDRAQHALALDYLKAGLLDRAENALRKLEGTSFEEEASFALLSIYERSRDWEHASQIASKLGGAGRGSFAGRQAHYLCEQANALVAAGEVDAAIDLLEQACQLAPTVARPLIELAKLNHQRGQTQAALDNLLTLEETAPQNLPLATSLMVSMAEQRDAVAGPIVKLLKSHYQHTPSVDVMQAMAILEKDPVASRQAYMNHLESEASLVAATHWIAGENLGTVHQNQLLKRALDQATKPLMRYRCAACGFEATQHFWHCPGCQAWDSYPARRIEEL